MKICIKCKVPKEEEFFDFNKFKNRLENHCKECRKLYVKEHYNKNKQVYKDRAKLKYLATRDKYIDYKSKLSCVDCGLSFKGFEYLCDFHHTENNKEISPSELVSYSWNILMKEISKCIPLCANCHRIRTYS